MADTRSACSPSARAASNRSSSASSRSASSRPASAVAQVTEEDQATQGRARGNAAAIVSAAPRASPARAVRAAVSSSSNSMASTTASSSAYPSAASRIVSAQVPGAAGSGAARRFERRRKLASPERLDQCVGTTRPARKARQATRACRLFAPGTSTGRLADHLERPQQPNFELFHWRVLRSLEQSGTPGGAV